MKKSERMKQLATILYPWDDWFSKSSFTIKRGIHFSCTLSGMAQQVRNAALKRKKKVSITLNADLQQLVVVVSENSDAN